MNIILSSRRRHYAARVSIFLVTVALIAGTAGCNGAYIPPPPPSQNLEIRDWYDLDAIRNNLAGNHTLMNDLDSATDGYEELASPTANQGKGWDPIGTFIPMCAFGGLIGTFDGQGYEIRDLYINRPDEYLVGLFGCVYEEGVIKDIGVMNSTLIGKSSVGGLVGRNMGTASNSYAIGSVGADFSVGGLVGYNQGPVNNCYATGNVVAGGVVGNVSAVMGGFGVGGLVGVNEEATVSNCYFTGSVTSYVYCVDGLKFLVGVGSLVGVNYGTVNDSYSNANVTGEDGVGGLVGRNLDGTMSNSYFTGSVTGNSDVGGLMGSNIGGCGAVINSYSTSSVTGNEYVGGLVGHNYFGTGEGTVSNCFWDIQTSGQSISDGGTGKTTAEMKDIATFSGAAWDIIAVAPGLTNTAYIWNIVDDATYPFLSWQP